MTTLYTASSHARAPQPGFPLPKPVIVLVCLFVPLWGTLILHYMWRNTHPEAARYVNRLGWLMYGGLFLLAVVAGAIGMRAGKARQARPSAGETTKGGVK